jgi:hypothetical protein
VVGGGQRANKTRKGRSNNWKIRCGTLKHKSTVVLRLDFQRATRTRPIGRWKKGRNSTEVARAQLQTAKKKKKEAAWAWARPISNAHKISSALEGSYLTATAAGSGNMGTWEHGNGGGGSREMAGTRGAGRKHEGHPNGLSCGLALERS